MAGKLNRVLSQKINLVLAQIKKDKNPGMVKYVARNFSLVAKKSKTSENLRVFLRPRNLH